MDKELRDALLVLCAIVWTVMAVWNFIEEKSDRKALMNEIAKLDKEGNRKRAARIIKEKEESDIRRIRKQAAKDKYEYERPKSEIEWTEEK